MEYWNGKCPSLPNPWYYDSNSGAEVRNQDSTTKITVKCTARFNKYVYFQGRDSEMMTATVSYDSDCNSADPHNPSDFTSAISIRTDAIETEKYFESLSSGRSTPESHIANCPGPTGYGQGAPAYSCGCYRWGEKFKSEPPLELVCNLRTMCHWPESNSSHFRNFSK